MLNSFHLNGNTLGFHPQTKQIHKSVDLPIQVVFLSIVTSKDNEPNCCNLMIFLFKVTKELKSFNKKVVECTWDAENNQWKFLRVREDKSFPNGYKTAMSKSNILKILFNSWITELW